MLSFDLTFSQWIIFSGFCLYLLYRFITRNNDFFLKRGIKFVKPTPFLGVMAPIIFRKTSIPEAAINMYNEFPNEKIIGAFEFLKPVYLIRDPELIKQVTIKQFDHFVNHRQQIDVDVEPMFGRGLFSLRDQKWRNMRATLSPAFTGSKMRQMFTLMNDCAKDTVSYFKEATENKSIEMEMKDFFTRFTNDVIATCAFGIKTNSFKEKENEFYLMGKSLTNLDGIQSAKFFAYSSFPKIMKYLKIEMFDKKLINFFRNLVHGAIKYRKDNNIIRPDMINLLMQAQQGSLKHEESDKKFELNDGFATVKESEVGKANKTHTKWTDDDLTAQCLLFLMAGFDTVATLMSFMSFELAFNKDIQIKLQEEIDAVNVELNGEPVTYEIVQNMKYLDMIVCETLRKWPPAINLDRYCNETTILKTNDNLDVQLNVGDGLWIPVFAIHNDPLYYPNPTKFDPERFSDENKDTIKPFSYLPFGLGPRNCIGSRFALIEAKVIFFELLSELSIDISSKCEYPIKLAKFNINLLAENGIWVQFKKRVK